MAKSRGRRRALLARAQELVTGKGNDGLTKQVREEYARSYREKALQPLSDREQDAIRAWQERKRDHGRSDAPNMA